MSESKQQSLIRLEASRKGITLFRNNSGVLFNDRGTPVRYGLSNDSAQINRIMKSSDLIGIKRVLITPEMVGTLIGQFVSIEVKDEDWKYTPTDRHVAQKAWIDLINHNGGLAFFATKPEDVK